MGGGGVLQAAVYGRLVSAAKNNKQTALINVNMTRQRIYELNVSYAPIYILRSNGYLKYN